MLLCWQTIIDQLRLRGLRRRQQVDTITSRQNNVKLYSTQRLNIYSCPNAVYKLSFAILYYCRHHRIDFTKTTKKIQVGGGFQVSTFECMLQCHLQRLSWKRGFLQWWAPALRQRQYGTSRPSIINKNSSGDEIADVNFLTTISHTRRPTSKYRKRDKPTSFNKLDDRQASTAHEVLNFSICYRISTSQLYNIPVASRGPSADDFGTRP